MGIKLFFTDLHTRPEIGLKSSNIKGGRPIDPTVNTPTVIAPTVNTPTVIAPTLNTPTVNTPAVIAPTVNTPTGNPTCCVIARNSSGANRDG